MTSMIARNLFKSGITNKISVCPEAEGDGDEATRGISEDAKGRDISSAKLIKTEMSSLLPLLRFFGAKIDLKNEQHLVFNLDTLYSST